MRNIDAINDGNLDEDKFETNEFVEDKNNSQNIIVNNQIKKKKIYIKKNNE